MFRADAPNSHTEQTGQAGTREFGRKITARMAAGGQRGQAAGGPGGLESAILGIKGRTNVFKWI